MILSKNKVFFYTYVLYVTSFLLVFLYSTSVFCQDWQQKFTDAFSSSPNYTSLYIMVSSSGYSNVGHVAIYIDDSTQSGKIEKVEANANKVSLSKALSKSSVNYIKSFLSSKEKLSEFPYKSFGGINFKYLHLEKNKTLKNYTVVKLLNMKNPEAFKEKPGSDNYISLKNFFYDMDFLKSN